MRRTATAAIILTTGLLFSACSSEDDTSAADPETSSSAAPDTEATPSEEAEDTEDAGDTGDTGGDSGDVPADAIAGLALTAEDFPAPYEFTPLPPGALDAGGDAIGGLLAGAEFTPAACGEASQATQGADLSQAGVAIAVDQSTGSSLTSALSPEVEQTVDFDEIAETCATYSFSLNGPGGETLDGDATLELLPEPEVEADDARAIRTSVTISLAGQEQTVDTLVYAAELRGVSVVSSGTGGIGGAELDTAVLEDLLVAGLDKVRAAP